ncbi:Nitroreductase [Sporobacter termitidis DSM 10068]|uniref:Nitroreductase n=1 Tax=Sporobacter termitidis DSM 10068 TaxID=1123282 RepID=A0A1M5YLL9_9FIRM|nr:nitroreductase family protein [Sporobacter termitidis]SHI12829.1 Nitroreductase [Sporobacter termitidis DSM 10068]
MNFLELAEKRYSVRKFSNTPVEREKLDMILQAGRLAPTAHNNQPQSILVLQSREALEKLKGCTRFHFDAPAALIVCSDQSLSWKRPYDNKDHGDIDASIVCAHMMLAAADLGLGTTWVCHYDPDAVIREFSLPENIVPSSILPLGYPADDAAPSARHADRKPLAGTVKFI